jgi:hypothetical protein
MMRLGIVAALRLKTIRDLENAELYFGHDPDLQGCRRQTP